MFDKKKYYISSLSLQNRYCVKKELESSSVYERLVLTSDDHGVEYAILFERIGNYIPNQKPLFFEAPIHNAIVYPVDLIKITNVYVCENEIGYVYPSSFLDYASFDIILHKKNKDEKAKILEQLCCLLEDIHNNKIYLNGFDKKQILLKNGGIKFRYNGFKNHNRNSIYRVPDTFAVDYYSIPWIFDVFSLVAIIFECMYEWNPFCGRMTSFSTDEEYQFEVFFNNFRKKIFIFERDKKLNSIGFLIEQRTIIEKWSETDKKICDFFHSILTMDIPESYTKQIVFEKIHKVIDYYKWSKIF